MGETRHLSYWVVYRIVRRLQADLLTLAHQGTKAYSEALDLVHRCEAAGLNAIWQADHSPLDILLIRPDGEPQKPWLTIVLDYYSHAVAGYFVSFEPPSTHGSEFTSRRLEEVTKAVVEATRESLVIGQL